MAFTADRVLSVASPDLSGLSQCSGGNRFGLLNIFFTKPCGFLGLVPCSCRVVYKLILSRFIPVFLVGIEFELVMSRFLKPFLLEIFSPYVKKMHHFSTLYQSLGSYLLFQ